LLVFIACVFVMPLTACVKESGPARTPAGWRANVSTLAGDGSPGSLDGAARAARFNDPFGLTVGTDGSVYVADAGASNRIRKITPRGEVSTLAGGREGFADGAGADASFNTPSALAADAEGNLYVADTGNNRVRKVAPDGNVTTIAGDGAAGFKDGPAAQAEFDAPVGVAVDKEGNVYVADTYNDRVRVVTKDGSVKTIAGAGSPGYADGDALTAALFDTPCALAVADAGEVYVADTGNGRLRKITRDGQVTTLPVFNPAPDARPDAAPQVNAPSADAPSGDAESAGAGDNGNPNAGDDKSLAANGDANTGAHAAPGNATTFELSKPAGLALTRDGFLYVSELDRARVVQVAPDGTARPVAGLGPGFADGDGQTVARFNQPAGLALAPDGSLLVADGANYLVRRLSPSGQKGGDAGAASEETGRRTNGQPTAQATPGAAGQDARQTVSQPARPDEAQSSAPEVLPRIPAESFSGPFPWPLDPQTKWHEVSATMGEVRGAYDSADSRDHLHSGVDVFGTYGQTVRAVLGEKVTSPLPNWGFGTLNEGLRVGLITYVHLRVGRDERDQMLNGTPFVAVRDPSGKVARVRVRRGTRLSVGDVLGTVNRMYHVHMNLGPPGAESNPLALPLAGFGDHVAPRIERDGVQLFNESGERLTEKRGGRLLLRGRVRIVVDAYDQVDGNQPRRRLGLYRLGYQLLLPSGEPAPGFERPRIQIEFNRLPPGGEAPKIAYADSSGITVYGSKQTRFLYELTNTVRDGRAARGVWDTSELPPGDYTLRILASDFNGNEANEGRDVAVTIER
jgi:sugar lactone lactonase YvrE